MIDLVSLDTEVILVTLMASIVVFALTLVLMPYLIRRMKHAGVVGIDFHKITRPKIPEMGGIGIVVALVIGMIFAAVLLPEAKIGILSAVLMISTSAIVGLLDDFKRLGAKTKPVLTALACWPVFLLQTYSPFPILPFIGRTRLTIVYPLMIPLGTAMAANAVNMLDVFNGAMPSTCVPVAIALLICSIVLGSTEGAVLSAILASALMAYYVFNRYPARVFSGDVGSLTVGTTIAAIAIIGRLEVFTVIAMIPFIMNSFHSLASIGRLFERGQIRRRPTYLAKDGRIAPSTDPKAPLTLTRIVLATSPLREDEVVRVFLMLSILSSIFAILTVFLFI